MWELIGVLLLLVLGIVICLALGRGHNEPRAFESTPVRINGRFSTPEYFMLWPDSWLAIKSRDLLAVQAALSLHNARPCSWLEGFANADRLFIAPPVKGWILVTGAGLPEPGHDVDACFRFVLDLSRKLGEVQFFNANRAFHNHAWVRAYKGRILRAYAWAGTTLWLQGPMTRSEMELALKCYRYGEPCSDLLFGHGGAIEANVEKVPMLAARWGLDPTAVQAHLPLNEHGIAGRAARRY
jgi:hypothetical protein